MVAKQFYRSAAKAVALLLVLCSPLGSEDPATSFAHSYNTWINLRQQAHPNTINASELRAWQQCKQDWKLLERTADHLY